MRRPPRPGSRTLASQPTARHSEDLRTLAGPSHGSWPIGRGSKAGHAPVKPTMAQRQTRAAASAQKSITAAPTRQLVGASARSAARRRCSSSTRAASASLPGDVRGTLDSQNQVRRLSHASAPCEAGGPPSTRGQAMTGRARATWHPFAESRSPGATACPEAQDFPPDLANSIGRQRTRVAPRTR
jgi:hypothetical protein